MSGVDLLVIGVGRGLTASKRLGPALCERYSFIASVRLFLHDHF